VWTDKRPKSPGFYWWRMATGPYPRITDVVQVVSAGRYFRVLSSTFQNTSMKEYAQGEWAGPIPEPGEPNGTN
jgi:hypothetical protein